MGRYVWLWPLLIGCAREASPHYMADGARAQEEIRADIRKELGPGFSVESLDEIFYVASNAGPALTRRCNGTVTRMARFLQRDFFTKKPTRPIRIYLFRDRATYETYCKKAHGREPSTPFGFYLPSERKMVMNIATGTGTLAHELVHPLLAEDFPDVPSWFNEGFASLFEQSWVTTSGDMKGLVNWRLPRLQRALRDGRGVSLGSIMKTTTDEFYGDDRGVHYATARYLCLYLQERGLLRDFYRTFRKDFRKERTGRTALAQVTKKKIADVEREWKAWVLRLRYDP